MLHLDLVDFLFVILSILIITVLIVVHEFGHFIAARFYGFQTPVFGIGLPFGPYIELFEKWETKFRFYFALIGGFVAIPETGDETNEELLKELGPLKTFRKFPVYQRAIVASAGVIFNVIFAFLIAVVMANSTGLPSYLPSNKVVSFVQKQSYAREAGLLENDEIVAVDGKAIVDGVMLKESIDASKGKKVLITVKRAENEGSDTYIEEDIEVFSDGSIGVVLGVEKFYEKSVSFIRSIWDSMSFIAINLMMMAVSIFSLFGALFTKIVNLFGANISDGSVHLGDVKGIVGIVQLISEDLKNNLWMVLEFAVILNLNLAVINLLPIPALDGGHLLFLVYEAIIGEKPSQKLQDGLVQAGFTFLLLIMAVTTINDIKSWIVN